MEAVHDPDRYMADLRQILSQGRKRIGLLIGAGAPISIRVDENGQLKPDGRALIPGVDELTSLVIAGITSEDQRTAANALKNELGDQANIESILSKIRLLEKAIGGTKIHNLDSSGFGNLGYEVCVRIGKIVDAILPAGRNAYNELIAWIVGTQRTHAVEIFTPNYDLLFEEAFEKVHAPYFDGFTGGSKPFFDPVTVAGNDLPSRWSRLWKLHGSLGWRLDGTTIVRTGGRGEAQLIYPDHLKYDLTQKQPYSALFERLKRFVLEPDTLLMTVGFSFRDSHISAVLDEATAMNANASIFAFQHSSLSGESAAAKMGLDHPNISVYTADGAVINGVVGKWRPGELQKNWAEIRASFWGVPREGAPHAFLLGDFGYFARFCALAQSKDITNSQANTSSPEPANEIPE